LRCGFRCQHIQPIHLDAPLAIGRGGGDDLVQDRLQRGMLRSRRVDVQLVQVGIEDQLGACDQFFQNGHQRIGVGLVDRIDLQLARLGLGGHGRRRRILRFGDGFDYLLDVGHDARPIRDKHLFGRNDRKQFVVGAQQRRYGGRHGGRITAAQ
jgi:hypothetical protein